MLTEDASSIQEVFLAIVEQGYQAFLGCVAFGCIVFDELQNRNDSDAIVGGTKAGRDAIKVGIYQDSTIVTRSGLGIFPPFRLIILRSPDVDDNVCSFEVYT